MEQIKTSLQRRITKSSGFTLIELLVVITILGILTTMAAPSIVTILSGTNLNRAGQVVSDQFTLARQEAITRNANVIVRFYQLPKGTTTSWCAIQVLRTTTSNGTTTKVPVQRIQQLPEGIVISSDFTLSPLLNIPNRTGTIDQPPYGNVSYAEFLFRPNGSTENAVIASNADKAGNNFVTLKNATAKDNPLVNYYTVQVNPLTGKPIIFRP